MVRYVAGDERAFEEVFRRYAPRVLGYMRRGYLTGREAEDLAQQTFLQLHRARFDYRPDRPLGPWLMTIARNVKHDFLRRIGRRGVPAGLEGLEPASDDPGGPRLEAREAVEGALAHLPASLRRVVELHWLSHLSFAEVAESLGISRSAAKVRAHRAYRALRRFLEDRAGDAPGCSRRGARDVSEGERRR